MLTAAVIGCGPAGIATATKLRQKGHMVTVFEIASEPGGIWNANGLDAFTSRGLLSPIYSSMRCVLPKDFMAFSDARMDFTAPQFPHHTVVRNYLRRYSELKGVKAITRFNTKVESCRYDEAAKAWKLVTVNIAAGDVLEWTFDRVAVCTGQHHQPRYPENWKAMLAEFINAGGDVMHSAHLKQFRNYKGKRALVVGDGVGAYDCMRELIRNGASVTHSSSLVLEEDVTNSFAQGMESLRLAKKTGKWQRDPVSWLSTILRYVPLLPRSTEHHAHQVIARWLRYQSTEMLRVPRVGRICGSVGRQVLCEEDPTKKQTQEEVLQGALERGLRKPITSRADAASGGGGGADSGTSDDAALQRVDSNQNLIDEVDLVVFATGYELGFPFLHQDVRRLVEGRSKPLQITEPPAASTEEEKSEAGEASLESRGHNAATHERRGLYLGVLYSERPSLAFVGTQRELLPPFMMFDAQALFVANAFAGRLNLPTTAQGLESHETELVRTNPELQSLYSADRGLGLHSAAYFNALHQELGFLETRTTYSKKLSERKWWVLLNAGLMAVHKLRSMAPLKRKKQHLLFSNKI